MLCLSHKRKAPAELQNPPIEKFLATVLPFGLGCLNK